MLPRIDDDEVVPTSDDDEMQQMRSDPLDLLGDGVRTPKAVDTSLELNDKAAGGFLPSQPPITFLAGATEKLSSTITSGTFGSSAAGPHPAIVAAVTPVIQEAASVRRGPKPRPAYKIRPATEDGIAQPTMSTSVISNVLTPVMPHPQLPTDPIETATTVSSTSKGKARLIEDSIESFSLDIAERAKIRSRVKTIAKTFVVEPTDIIELTSESEDELLLPSSKPKTKDKPKKIASSKAAPAKKAPARKSPAKKAQASHGIEAPDSTPVTLPVPTSDPVPSSQLPPSDLPPPSSVNLLPTSTPVLNLSPPLSPPPAPPARKRKRPAHADSDDEDAAAPYRSGVVTTASAEFMPPPPPPAFFASSSPPAGPSGLASSKEAFGPLEQSMLSVLEPKAKVKGRKKAADDEDEDWMGDDPKPKPKGRGRKKKTEEEEDEDWDDKPKPKAKVRAKRSPKKKNDAFPTATMEGADPDTVLVPKPKKAPARGRGKKAQAAAADAVEGAEEDDAPAKPAPAAKKAPARGRGKKVVEVVIEVPSPVRRSAMTHNDGEQAEEPSAPALAPQPLESELSALDSDEEGKRNSSGRSALESEKPGSSNVKGKSRRKKRALVVSDEDDGDNRPLSPKKAKSKAKITSESDDERNVSGPTETSNREDAQNSSFRGPLPRTPALRPSVTPSSASTMRSFSHQIPKAKGVSMSELIRRASQAQGSPVPSTVYSPLIKMSKGTLRNIAPLHPNRKPPPPPPPRPPPPKKSKKELELEEKWEMELEDEVEGWHSLSNEERARLRRAKRDAYYGFDD